MAITNKSDFNVVRCLRRGAFDTVTLCQRKGDFAEFVLKQVNLTLIHKETEQTEEAIVETCRKEYLKMKQIKHQNLVQIFGAFEEVNEADKFYCLAIEYCQGGDLSVAITEARLSDEPISECQIQSWANQLVSGIKFLHENGQIHRDIRPKNIFMASDRNIVKLGNFGLAESDKNGRLMPVLINVAAWLYASPQVCQGQGYTKPDDVWSLGVVIYELANLKRPFFGSGPAVVCAIVNKEPDPFLTGTGYSNELGDFAMDLLTKAAAKRPSIGHIFDRNPFLKLKLEENSGSRKLASLTNVETRDHLGRTPLLEAACEGHGGIVEWLLANGANVEARDQSGMLGIHLAAWFGHLTVVTCLLSKRPDFLEAKTTDNDTALNCAAIRGHLETVRYLVENGANLESRGFEGRTPLLQAASEGNRQVFEWLLENGANIDALSDFESMAIHLAAKFGHKEIVECLLAKKPALLEAKAAGNDAPLNYAAFGGQLEMVKFLIKERSANVENRGYQGKTPLLDAAANGNFEIADWLLENGANIEAKDDSGNTLLHLVAFNGHGNALTSFLTGARKDRVLPLFRIKNSDNETPFGYAKRGEKAGEIVELLRSYGVTG